MKLTYFAILVNLQKRVNIWGVCFTLPEFITTFAPLN